MYVCKCIYNLLDNKDPQEKMPLQENGEIHVASRKSKEQWFKVNVEILMQRMNHSNTDLHVLQWRHGCEIDEFNNGTVKFLRGIDQDRYDGSDFLSFDNSHRVWVAPVQAAEETKRKWDGVAILNQYTQGYLEKECVDWLTKFMEYGKETLRKHSPPALYMSAKRSRIDPRKLTLTCLATGFYPKDVVMTIRKKFGTSLPEHLLTSSGIRPNDDGTYQLRKSAEINGDDPADYDCYVNHTTLEKPVITKWGYKLCPLIGNECILVARILLPLPYLLAPCHSVNSCPPIVKNGCLLLDTLVRFKSCRPIDNKWTLVD
uniref:Ig-like domain-containing protein n=1 Tax=Astyanax mexicanus TaxID=7994 RepID=A0A8B9HX45_ASTMX